MEGLESCASRSSELVSKMKEATYDMLKTTKEPISEKEGSSAEWKSDEYALALEYRLTEKECELLYKERDRLLDELEEGNTMLHVLSEDHANLEKEVTLVDSLQAQIYHLKKLLLSRENEITRFHIENNHLRLSNGQLLKDVAQAIRDDEEEFARECNN
ncbi:hypothetical protein WA577_001871 [Blastocystis sp. JDR]